MIQPEVRLTEMQCDFALKSQLTQTNSCTCRFGIHKKADTATKNAMLIQNQKVAIHDYDTYLHIHIDNMTCKHEFRILNSGS